MKSSKCVVKKPQSSKDIIKQYLIPWNLKCENRIDLGLLFAALGKLRAMEIRGCLAPGIPVAGKHVLCAVASPLTSTVFNGVCQRTCPYCFAIIRLRTGRSFCRSASDPVRLPIVIACEKQLSTKCRYSHGHTGITSCCQMRVRPRSKMV